MTVMLPIDPLGAMRWTGPRYAMNFPSPAVGRFSITRPWRRSPLAPKTPAEWAADMAENGDVHEHRWLKRIEEVRDWQPVS